MGDGTTDHYCWQRPEDMTTSRQAYRIDPSNPGSDLAGESAAAMAAASLAFRHNNPSYANELLTHAQQARSRSLCALNASIVSVNVVIDLIQWRNSNMNLILNTFSVYHALCLRNRTNLCTPDLDRPR